MCVNGHACGRVKWPVRKRALAEPPELGMPEILNRVQQILTSDQRVEQSPSSTAQQTFIMVRSYHYPSQASTNLLQAAFNPTQIFGDEVTEEKGENARLSAFVGAIAVGDLVKSTLGPKGMDKILQSAYVTFHMK